MEQIDYDSGMPLYIQLKDIIKKQILEGRFSSGEKIPTEGEYCKKYSISRITVRQAINNLVQEKMLIRKQGKGTFVASVKLRKYLPKLYSFTEDMIAEGRVPDSIILHSSLSEADDETVKLLKLPAGNHKVFKLSRVRRADGIPLLFERAFIPDYICPGLGDYDFSEHSLYKVLQQNYKLIFKYAEERYEVTVLDKQIAGLLDLTINEPAFQIHRVAYLNNDKPYELTYAVGRGDAMSFTVTLVPETEFKRNY